MKFREYINEVKIGTKLVKKIINDAAFQSLSADDFDVRIDSHGVIAFFKFKINRETQKDIEILMYDLSKISKTVELNDTAEDPHIEVKR